MARHTATRASDPRRKALPPSMRDRVPSLLYRAAKDSAVAILDEQQSTFLAPLTEQERLHLGELLDRLYVSASARQFPQAASEQAD